MKNPFNEFYFVPDSQALLDVAFKKAMKSSAQVSKNAPILVKAKKKESKRIKTAIQTLISKILKIIKSVPIIDDLPDFYRELASILVDVDELRLTLGRLNGILPVLSQFEREYFSKLGRIEEPKEGDRLRTSAFGRISSVIKKKNSDLTYLNSIRGKLRELPSLDYTLPTIVCAGAPNVGKSSIVKNISTNKKIDVQEYPFTTKKLNLGHIQFQRRFNDVKIQIMDTPGILDRPMSKRNSIELQAILALRLISSMILFVFDPTPSSGYEVDSQVQLFQEIKENFTKEGDINIIIVFNKMDLASEEELRYLRDKLKIGQEEVFLTNALTGENLDKLKKSIEERYLNNG